VIHRALVLTAYICCGLVIASFALFARDQFAGASEHQQNELVAGQSAASPTAQTTTQPRHHGQPRAFIDRAAKVLTAPFRALVHTNSQWVIELGVTIMALLVYGVGIGFLARFARADE
jgi:hypothetical protein